MSCGCGVRDSRTVRAVRWFYIALFGFIITYAVFYVATNKTEAVAHRSPPPQQAVPHAEL